MPLRLNAQFGGAKGDSRGYMGTVDVIPEIPSIQATMARARDTQVSRQIGELMGLGEETSTTGMVTRSADGKSIIPGVPGTVPDASAQMKNNGSMGTMKQGADIMQMLGGIMGFFGGGGG